MLSMFLIGAAVLLVVAAKYLYHPAERCPDCGLKREDNTPICECGWVFEFPEDDSPLEYGEPDEDASHL
ncbi:MAG: hypothetical protein O2954_17555 [bacterium]|nr:hypothetical protein [bacterium]